MQGRYSLLQIKGINGIILKNGSLDLTENRLLQCRLEAKCAGCCHSTMGCNSSLSHTPLPISAIFSLIKLGSLVRGTDSSSAGQYRTISCHISARVPYSAKCDPDPLKEKVARQLQ